MNEHMYFVDTFQLPKIYFCMTFGIGTKSTNLHNYFYKLITMFVEILISYNFHTNSTYINIYKSYEFYIEITKI